jgi:nitrogen fixation protein NifQ
MEPASLYASLTNGAEGALHDPADRHVVGCVLALALAEAKVAGTSVCERVGLSPAALLTLVTAAFPDSIPLFENSRAEAPSLQEDESNLRELLAHSTTSRTPFEFHLAAIIAHRAMRSNHLWQDMGLRNRGELSELLNRHFAPLAKRNTGNMKWKKFFFRTICGDEGFRLCSAPSCEDCDDFPICFGDESGESLLARIRNANVVQIRPV